MKEDFNLTLTRYGLERLLYRLSISEHAPNFLLKGALLFQLWYGQAHRPTRDADLLGFGSDDVTTSIEVFRSVCSLPVDDDGIVFNVASVNGAEIREAAIYGGVRIQVRATLDRARIALQVDVGFGDAVTPMPESIRYPTLIDDVAAPILRAYPKATVVAEKLHAVCVLGMANSRMKDFFDLSVLSMTRPSTMTNCVAQSTRPSHDGQRPFRTHCPSASATHLPETRPNRRGGARSYGETNFKPVSCPRSLPTFDRA